MPTYPPIAPARGGSIPPKGLDLDPNFDPTSIYTAIREFGYDMSPLYGDVRAGQRSLEAYDKSRAALENANPWNAAKYGAQGLTEQISTIPVMGEVAGFAKGLTGLAGTMLGKKGMSRLNPAKVAKFDELTKQDTTPTEIWNQLQSYVGPGGQPRYEIPDWDAKIDFTNIKPKTRVSGLKSQKLHDLMNHPDFTKAYPEINPDIIGMRFPKSESMKGYYDPDENHIVLNWTQLDEEAKALLQAQDAIPLYGKAFKQRYSREQINQKANEVARNTIFHELQHNVQKIEGFPKGGHYTDKDYNQLAGEVEANVVGLRSLGEDIVSSNYGDYSSLAKSPVSQMPFTFGEQVIKYDE